MIYRFDPMEATSNLQLLCGKIGVQGIGQSAMFPSLSDSLLLPPLAIKTVMIMIVIIEALQMNMAALDAAVRGKREHTQQTLLSKGKHRCAGHHETGSLQQIWIQQLATMHFVHVMHMPVMCMAWGPDAMLSLEDEHFFAKRQNNAS